MSFFSLYFSGTSTSITQEDLLSTDVDSDNKQLLYTVTLDPEVGRLAYSKNGIEFDITSSGPKSTFTQTDVDNGKYFSLVVICFLFLPFTKDNLFDVT